jgi:hypothetical protein
MQNSYKEDIMKSILWKLTVFFLIFIFFGLIWQFIPSSNHSSDKRLYPVIGNAKKLKGSYEIWKAKATKNGADGKMTLRLGYNRGLSFEFTEATGQASLDLINGAFSVQVFGLNDKEHYDVWLIDNIEGSKKSVKPEPGDKIVKIGTLKNVDGSFKLHDRIDPQKFKNFKLDLVAVTAAGKEPSDSGLIFGSPTLFQRLYYSELRGEFGNLNDKPAGSTQKSLLSTPFSIIIPEPAFAKNDKITNGDLNKLELLVHQGEDLFFNETFGGNGRTCGTCHPMENNLTIDPEFIATLPDDDPLFVAEFNPDLSENFEKPDLMHQFGVILENLDGFGDLEHKFVMRGVPHTLALTTSIAQADFDDFPGLDDDGPGGVDGPTDGQTPEALPAQMTGWSGDGAPGGALRDFPTGAVTQHFTKTLARTPGVDFTLPTDDELDAMEAFQLSLGRQEDPILKADNTATPGLKLKDPSAIAGKAIFINGGGNISPADGKLKGGKCITCHTNGGATSGRGGEVGLNRNTDTGIEDRAKPAIFAELGIPRDGGFGTVNRSPFDCPDAPSPDCGFGDSRFNTAPLIEAADTPPFFHNNTVNTLEEAISTYNGDEFNLNPNNPNPRADGAQILLTEPQIAQVATFLRVINSLDNIRNSNEFLVDARSNSRFGINEKIQKLRLSLFDIDDAIDVLSETGLHPSSVTNLNNATGKIEQAINTHSTTARNALIDDAIEFLDSAKDEMCTAGSDPVLCP